jgi:hypothetical protein
MQHALNDLDSSDPTALPATPVGAMTCGVDWAKDDHVACLVDFSTGKVKQRLAVEHTAAGRRAGARVG